MAWSWVGLLARNVPWGELVRRTPDIISASRKLLDKSGEQGEAAGRVSDEAPAPDPKELEERIAALEARDAEQARLIAQMVEQLQGVTGGLEVLAARNRLLMWVIAALIVANAAVLAVSFWTG